MSMNSSKGIWEIDGAAQVNESGDSIITKSGQGITHFSIVYAAPLSPDIRPQAAQQIPGADAFNGALTNVINLPSYKSLGQSITPQLHYSSAWANPTAVVSNTLIIPAQKVDIDRTEVTTKVVKLNCTSLYLGWFLPPSKRGCFENNVWFDTVREYQAKSETKMSSWYEPKQIDAQFFSGSIVGEKISFTGEATAGDAEHGVKPSTGIPDVSIVSYAMTLKDPASGKFLDSGVHTYNAHYDIHLTNFTIGTRKVTVTGPDYIGKPDQRSFLETRQLEQAFPQDIGGALYVNNQSESPAGRGWRIGGVQKIENPSFDRVLITEPNGQTSSYTITNTIETIFDPNVNSAPGSFVDFSNGASLGAWPDLYLSSGTYIGKIDLSLVQSGALMPSNALSWVAAPTQYNGIIAESRGYTFNTRRRTWDSTTCVGHPVALPPKPSQVVSLPDGRTIYSDSRGALFMNQGGAESVLAGRPAFYPYAFNPPPPGCTGFCFFDPPAEAKCAQLGVDCSANFPISCATASSGFSPNPGDADGVASGWGFSNPNVNNPMGVAVAPDGRIAIADTGNNKVKIVDLTTGAVSTIAGNGQTFDSGDNGPATSASLYHPRGVAYDSVGNLYVSTQNGYIRKIDPNGIISTFAGLPAFAGGILSERIDAAHVQFNQPYGLVVDNTHGYLYVADTNNHRVVRIDFDTRTAVAVAGNGTPTYGGDAGPALNASLNAPTHLGLDNNKNLLIVDAGNNRVRRVVFQNIAGGTIAYEPATKDSSRLVRSSDGTWTRSYRDGNRAIFDNLGLQIEARDRVGRVTYFSYDVDSRLTAVTDPAGRVTQYSYSGDHLRNITDPAGRQTSFSHDGSGNLTRVTFSDGSQRNFSYDVNGLMRSETDALGNETEYKYNQWGRIESVTKANGSIVEVNDSTSGTIGNNFTGGILGTLQRYDRNELYDGIKDAKSVETKLVKDISGYVTTIIAANGRVTKVLRDNLGKPSQVIRPDGSTVDFIYNSSFGDLTEERHSLTGLIKTYVYDQYGSLLSETDSIGHSKVTTYRGDGLALTTTDSLGRVISYAYDNPFGLPTAITNPQGKTIYATYDAHGNQIQTTDAAGKSNLLTLDDAGNTLASKDANGKVTEFTYDSFNRVKSVKLPGGQTTQYEYALTGWLELVRDAQGKTIKFEYDDVGRVTKKIDQLGFATTYAYDSNGNVIREIDPNGNVKEYTYDQLNRLIEKILPDGRIALAYDERGNTIQASSAHVTLNFEYDDSSRLLTATSQGTRGTPSTINYTYDPVGNRSTMAHSSGASATYSYDLIGRITAISNQRGEVFSFIPNDSQNKLTVSRPGSESDIRFGDSGLIASISHSQSGTDISSFVYAYDNVGNRTGVSTASTTITAGYDVNYQLASFSQSNPQGDLSESFSYDSIGNRIADADGNLTYEDGQRLFEDSVYRYFYDKNGNLLQRAEKSNALQNFTNYIYNSENQLISLNAYKNGQLKLEANYAYDPLGRRIEKQVIDHNNPSDQNKNYTRRYSYDGQEIVAEYNDENAVLVRYTHSNAKIDDILAADVTGAGVNAGIATASQSYMYLKDAQGSIIDVTDSNGNRLQHYVYSAFGKLLGIQDAHAADISATPEIRTSYTFTGREYDEESGLFYYRARYYDPRTGRFLQRDPEPGQLENPITVVNAQTYAGNNPLTFTDPTGRIFGIDDLLFIGIMAIAGAVIKGAVSNDWSIGSLLTGGLIGAGLGAATIAFSSVFSAIQGFIVGSEIAGVTLTGITGGAHAFLAYPTLFGEIAAGAAGIVAGIGAFAPNAGDGLKGFSKAFLLGGGILSFAKFSFWATSGLNLNRAYTLGAWTIGPIPQNVGLMFAHLYMGAFAMIPLTREGNTQL